MTKRRAANAVWVHTNGATTRFDCTTAHTAIDLDSHAFAFVEQIVPKDFPPTIEIGVSGQLVLESGDTPDVVDLQTSHIAFAEHAATKRFNTRLYGFGPNTSEARSIASAHCMQWLLNLRKEDRLGKLLEQLREETVTARRWLQALREERVGATASEVLTGSD